jgi:hypothetical protein
LKEQTGRGPSFPPNQPSLPEQDPPPLPLFLIFPLIVKTAIVLSSTADEKPEGPEIDSQLLSGYLKFIVGY